MAGAELLSVAHDASPRSSQSSLPELTGLTLQACAVKTASAASPSPSFQYDGDIFEQFQKYIGEKNYHGLALLTRQKGCPPFLRFKVWPMLLKHHPFVVNPFIQPDISDGDKSPSSDSADDSGDIRLRIRKDLRKYAHGVAFSSTEEPLSQTELQIFDILELAVCKFVLKWGRIIKYDLALTWIALGLAEWLPPIPLTEWVLLGRNVSSSAHTCIGLVFDEYSSYLEDAHLTEYMEMLIKDESLQTLKFLEVYERLALVILHSPELANKRKSSQNSSVKVDKSALPVTGGTIEERVSFFIHVFQKLLPELSQYFSEEQILNKFGMHEDEWLIWWLKYWGVKVWSRVDRGRVWDLLVGWRFQNKKMEMDMNYLRDKLHLPEGMLEKLGPDNFWLVSHADELEGLLREDSFKDLVANLNLTNLSRASLASSSSSANSLPVLSASSEISSQEGQAGNTPSVPFSRIDPHIELLFVSLALLKAKENTLVELDQHEIRTFLSRLPAKSLNLSNKYKQYQELKDKENGVAAVDHGFRYDYMDSVIFEAGELWRKWLWWEASGES